MDLGFVTIELGAPNVMNVPFLLRRNPSLELQQESPVISPAGSIDVAFVPVEPGGSNKMIVPSLSHKKP